jgi:hypothetical protein
MVRDGNARTACATERIMERKEARQGSRCIINKKENKKQVKDERAHVKESQQCAVLTRAIFQKRRLFLSKSLITNETV